jgi:molybdopterin molybdotransferase
MISVTEARQIVAAQCPLLETVSIPFQQSVGYVLAEDLISPVSIPFFRQSSMDGYAIRAAEKDQLLHLQDALPAGSSRELTLAPGNAIRVFTGGPVPEGADTVVQQEWISLTDKAIQINDHPVEIGANIRLPGADINKGEVAMPAGTQINAMHIGFMASLGITSVSVYRKPSVAILITGNELVQPGNELRFGQVYDANSFGLTACLQQLHISSVSVSFTKDSLAETETAIEKALLGNDLVLITGGVSVGDHDHVAQACANLGILKLFHGVKQRPGKPLFFGTLQHKWVFGLPGNPASVLSCFYQYVIPFIHGLTGVKPAQPLQAALAADFDKKAALRFFLKGFYADGLAQVSAAQASFQQIAFVQANCWIELPEEVAVFPKGTQVTIHPFL